jgi:hypothetical protein
MLKIVVYGGKIIFSFTLLSGVCLIDILPAYWDSYQITIGVIVSSMIFVRDISGYIRSALLVHKVFTIGCSIMAYD